ncbi:hypothetical protein CQW23_14506 [Capsicum baccatum]|uniref:Uncharacterized protein n=1 Tax=Capsicum baccatum TaxID=33114 RepID=A0A2G2WJC5_CAPBA|nr:hypothetical protein CQW23_14506 [Capsicum baccatum]
MSRYRFQLEVIQGELPHYYIYRGLHALRVYKMVSAIGFVAEMSAIGFGLSKDEFTSLIQQGSYLLALTGSDLRRYGKEGTIFSGYHILD